VQTQDLRSATECFRQLQLQAPHDLFLHDTTPCQQSINQTGATLETEDKTESAGTVEPHLPSAQVETGFITDSKWYTTQLQCYTRSSNSFDVELVRQSNILQTAIF
jgi:hypothetical protein